MDWIVRKTHAANGQPYGPDHKFMEGVQVSDTRSGGHDLIYAAAKEWNTPVTPGETYTIESAVQPRTFVVNSIGHTIRQ